MYQMSAISSGDGGTKMVVPLLHCSITDMFINRVPHTKLTNVFYLMFVQAYNPLLWNLLRLPSIITVIICHRYNSIRHIQFRDWANRYTGTDTMTNLLYRVLSIHTYRYRYAVSTTTDAKRAPCTCHHWLSHKESREDSSSVAAQPWSPAQSVLDQRSAARFDTALMDCWHSVIQQTGEHNTNSHLTTDTSLQFKPDAEQSPTFSLPGYATSHLHPANQLIGCMHPVNQLHFLIYNNLYITISNVTRTQFCG